MWDPVCCAAERAECFLHSWVTNPHDVIGTLTRCFFCALHPADKEQIKAGATMEILCAFFPRLLIRFFIYFDFALLRLPGQSGAAKAETTADAGSSAAAATPGYAASLSSSSSNVELFVLTLSAP